MAAYADDDFRVLLFCLHCDPSCQNEWAGDD
jgi:hypothetical protein